MHGQYASVQHVWVSDQQLSSVPGLPPVSLHATPKVKLGPVFKGSSQALAHALNKLQLQDYPACSERRSAVVAVRTLLTRYRTTRQLASML